MTASAPPHGLHPLGLPGLLSRLDAPHAGGYAVVDLETTGTSPETDRIVSCAIIGLDPDGSLATTLHAFVDPERPIPAEATRVHGITDEDAARCRPFRDHARAVLEAIAGRVLLAYNAHFDVPLLLNELARAGVPQGPPAMGCLLHAVQVAYPLAPAGHRLPQACALLGLDGPDDAHDAFSDARAAARIADSMLREGLDPTGTVLDKSLLFWLRAQVDRTPPTGAQIRRLFAIARLTPGDLGLADPVSGRVDRDRLLAFARETAPGIARLDDLDRRQLQDVFDRLEDGHGNLRRERGLLHLALLRERPGGGALPDGPNRWPTP